MFKRFIRGSAAIIKGELYNEALKCDHILGYCGVVACMMGVQSFRQRKYFKWDHEKTTVIEI